MTTRVSFADKFIQSGAIPIHLVRCKDTSGRDCHHFLMCPREKLKVLLAVKDGVFDLNDYGKVIASGFGSEPSDTTKKMLKEVYHFDTDTLSDSNA